MRARNIKPGFFKNAELADAGPHVQILFPGLWCMADKEGRLKDQPRVIKAEVFPYYEVDVNRELTVLERLGFIHRYVAAGIAVIEIRNFKKHQSPHHTERASELPACECSEPCGSRVREIHGEVTVKSPLSNGGNPSDSLIPDSPILRFTDSLIPDSNTSPPLRSGDGEPTRKKRAARPATRIPDDFALTEDRRQYAVSKSVEPDSTFEAFVAYWRSKATENTKLNWDLTWHTWVLKEAKDARQRSAPRKGRFEHVMEQRRANQ